MRARAPAAAAPRLASVLAWVLTCVLACCVLAGCVSPPPVRVPAAEPTATAADAASAAEQAELRRLQTEQRDAAQRAQRDGRHQAALQAWAVVLALAPNDQAAQAGLAQAQRTAGEAAASSTRRAELARALGDTDAAMRHHLDALAHNPAQPGAADALRALELDRVRRSASAAGARPLRPASAVGRTDAASAIEQADLLLADGDTEAALALLEPRARAPRASASLKNRVCDLLLREAQGQPAHAGAALAQRCLRLLPRHPQALRLQQRPRAAKAPGTPP